MNNLAFQTFGTKKGPSSLVTIGTQTWTNTNLDVVTYRDGTPIPQVTDQTQWKNLTTGAWCYFNNDSVIGATYGRLYNWYAVAGIDGSGTPRILAPVGYHIPTDAEWTILTDYLGGLSIAGGKMKEVGTTHWASPNTGATNSSGFTGFGGGNRFYLGQFVYFGGYGFWWTSSETGTGSANTAVWYRFLTASNTTVTRYTNNMNAGVNVRLIKD